MTVGFENSPGSGGATRRAENLAFLFQEIFTVVVRLRSNRQSVTDAAEFRTQITNSLTQASREASRRGYQVEDVKVAAYAVVALLDESVLNSNNQVFEDWLRNPLQAQLFGVLMAGDNYFRNIDMLLQRPESQDLADVLEIYLLGLLLGFRGRHGREGDYADSASGSGRATVRNVHEIAWEKIRRIRGPERTLTLSLDSAGAPLPVVAADPWRSRLKKAAIIGWVVAILLFAAFKVTLLRMPGGIPVEASSGQN